MHAANVCNRNRSKYQPKGHFDAAVGGRRRQQKAAAGSALEKLRQRRLQQAALSGAAQQLSLPATLLIACYLNPFMLFTATLQLQQNTLDVQVASL